MKLHNCHHAVAHSVTFCNQLNKKNIELATVLAIKNSRKLAGQDFKNLLISMKILNDSSFFNPEHFSQVIGFDLLSFY